LGLGHAAPVKAGRRPWPDPAWFNTKAGSSKLSQPAAPSLAKSCKALSSSKVLADYAYGSPL